MFRLWGIISAAVTRIVNSQHFPDCPRQLDRRFSVTELTIPIEIVQQLRQIECVELATDEQLQIAKFSLPSRFEAPCSILTRTLDKVTCLSVARPRSVGAAGRTLHRAPHTSCMNEAVVVCID